MFQNIVDINVQGIFKQDESWISKKSIPSNSEFFNYLKLVNNNPGRNLSQKNTELKNSENETSVSDVNKLKNTESDIPNLSLINVLRSLKDEGKESKWSSAAVQEEDLQKKNELLKIILASIENGKFNQNMFNNLLNELKFSDIELYNTIISNNFLNEKYLLELSNSGNFKTDNLQSVSTQNLNVTQFNNLKEGGELLNNIFEKIMVMIKSKSILSTINLGPNEIDKILLLYGNNNNQNSIDIKVDNVEIQKFIKDNIMMLKSALEKAGAKIDNLNINEIKVDFYSTQKENLLDNILVNENQENKQSLMNDMHFTNSFINLLNEDPNNKKELELLKNNFQQGFENILNNKANEISRKEPDSINKSLDSQKIIDNIIKNITQSMHNGKMEIEVKLIPENLGKMTVKVSMEEGNLSANIEVKYPEVKHIIETNLVRLRNDLQQNGVNLEKINVFLSDQRQFEGNQNRYLNTKNQNSNGIQDFKVEEEFDYVRYLGYNTIEIIA
jgi:flagellar hook-length control protein FliK